MWIENSARVRRCVPPCEWRLSGGEFKIARFRWLPEQSTNG